MRKLIESLFPTRVNKDALIVFGGTFVNIALGGIFFILAPRFLGPSDYGLFSTVLATAILATNIANFGIDSGILRFSDLKNHDKTDKVLKLALFSYTSFGLAVFLLGFLFSTPLAKFLDQETLSPLLKIASAGVILLLLTNFFIAILQSRKRFVASSIVQISSNLGRLIILLFAAYFFAIDLPFMTVLFFTINIVSVIIGKIFVPFEFLKSAGASQEFANFFRFNFWVAASVMIASIPVDNYLLIKLAGPVATGIYAAPYKLLTVVNQLSGNFSRLLASHLSSLTDSRMALSLVKKTSPIIIAISLLIILLIIFADPLIKILLGEQYLASVVVFRIVAASAIVFFASAIPETLTLYYFGKSNVSFMITLATMIIWFGGNFLLIPKYQALGAAMAILLYASSSLFLFTAYVVWRFQKGR